MQGLIYELKKALSANLPGLEAQSKLAPEFRNLYPEKENKIHASILLLVFKNEINKLTTVLMKRPTYEGHHSGQISFPGGKSEAIDTSHRETALRESYEELGIPPNKVEIIGQLTDLYIPISNFIVHPFIGYCAEKPVFKINKKEVNYLIFCTLQQMIKLNISFTSMSYKSNTYKVPYFDISNEMVWGATAMILSELIEILKNQSTLL
jgi:8-oxo-dGTP pyrophosphatase MutT (NUDIX family)